MHLLLLIACSAPGPADLPALQTREPDVVRFVALGDAGREGELPSAVAAAIARTCAARGCDLGLLLGDNLYDRGLTSPDDPRIDAVTAPLRAMGIPWLMVHGNHDYGHGVQAERAAWARDWASRTEGMHHPAPWYRTQAGPAELVALDTTWAFWRTHKPQARWLGRTLEASTARWKVVFGHHTFRSEGKHGNAGAYEGWVNLPWASGNSLESLFDDALCPGADLYLSGHDHSLQLLEHCGVNLVVSGAGSSPRPLDNHGNRPAFASPTAGFAWVELGQLGRVLFFDANGALLHESGAISPRAVLY